jgi:hypothetical protein
MRTPAPMSTERRTGPWLSTASRGAAVSLLLSIGPSSTAAAALICSAKTSDERLMASIGALLLPLPLTPAPSRPNDGVHDLLKRSEPLRAHRPKRPCSIAAQRLGPAGGGRSATGKRGSWIPKNGPIIHIHFMGALFGRWKKVR